MAKPTQSLSVLHTTFTTREDGATEPDVFRAPAIQVSIFKPNGRTLLSAGTKTIDLSDLPSTGAQFLRIAVEALNSTGPASPVRANWTDHDGQPSSVSVPPGGEVRLWLPGTQVGPASLTLVLTSEAVCHISYGG